MEQALEGLPEGPPEGLQQPQAAAPHTNGVHPAAADGLPLGADLRDDEAMSDASHAREERVVVRGPRGSRPPPVTARPAGPHFICPEAVA